MNTCYVATLETMQRENCNLHLRNEKPFLWYFFPSLNRIVFCPKLLCNSPGVLSHLQMGVIVMGFAADLRFALYEQIFSASFVIFHLQMEFYCFCYKVMNKL